MKVELICDNPECGLRAEPGDQPPTRIRAPRRWTIEVDAELLDTSRFALSEKASLACPACGTPAERIIGGTL